MGLPLWQGIVWLVVANHARFVYDEWMDLDTFAMVLRSLTRRRPFLPFFLELASGERLDVSHPEALIIQQGVIVFRSAQRDLSVLTPTAVVRFCQPAAK